MRQKVNLASFHNEWYHPGKSKLWIVSWYFVNAFFFKSYIFPFSSIKCSILRFFGAKVGKGVIIKPNVNIKYPWRLKIGDNCWIGEEVWIDNLEDVSIGNNCCLSQAAFLLCGNHNYRSVNFDLMIAPIVLENGSWIGAKSLIAPGSLIKSHAVISAASFFSGTTEEYAVYAGNPAVKVKERVVS